jgi:hypothetical protein
LKFSSEIKDCCEINETAGEKKYFYSVHKIIFEKPQFLKIRSAMMPGIFQLSLFLKQIKVCYTIYARMPESGRQAFLFFLQVV